MERCRLTPWAVLEPVMATIKAGQPISLKKILTWFQRSSKSCHELVGQSCTSVSPVHHEAAVSGLMPMHDMPGISVNCAQHGGCRRWRRAVAQELGFWSMTSNSRISFQQSSSICLSIDWWHCVFGSQEHEWCLVCPMSLNLLAPCFWKEHKDRTKTLCSHTGNMLLWYSDYQLPLHFRILTQ